MQNAVNKAMRGGSMHPYLKRFIRFLLGAMLVVALPGAAMLFGAWMVFHYAPAGPLHNGGPNALWAAHKWVGESHSERDYDLLVRGLRRNRITDVYFHVGPLAGDGTISPGRYPNSEYLLASLRARAPTIRLHAWIGQVERGGGGPLDLGAAATRANIVATAEQIIDLGFDGIHYNIEPIRSGDRDLLALLDATRVLTRERGVLLSMATDEVEPFPGAEYLVRPLAKQAGLWSPAYYQAVASRLDQVAVMMYDTAMPFDWLYGAVVAYETWRLADLAGPGTALLMGVPTAEERRSGFNPDAENMRSALRGIRIGLHYAGDPAPANFGAAVYADWVTEESEWAIWRRDWLGRAE